MPIEMPKKNNSHNERVNDNSNNVTDRKDS